jgi:hypothetical protein
LKIVEPRLERFSIPGHYADGERSALNTVRSTAFLLTGADVEWKDIYYLLALIHDNRVFLVNHDKGYRAITEDFNRADLNFPLHEGAARYLARNQPTVIERYADLIGLSLSFLIILFGGFQSARRLIEGRKKERLDRYFESYLEIKNNPELNASERLEQYELLHSRALQQMIAEKLNKDDFNFFSHMVRAEETIAIGLATKKQAQI